MSVINNNLLLTAAAAAAAGGYQVSRSLRFNSADSANLSRTPGSAGNQKTWTWSGWVKRSTLGSKYFFGAIFASSMSRYQLIGFDSSDKLVLFGGDYSTGGSTTTNVYLQTTAVYRDVSAWYHLVLAVDTTQATSTNRVKLYVNGTQVTDFGTATYPAQNSESYINSVQPHYVGDWGGGFSLSLDGYLADIYFLDGTATTPSTFAETDAITGQWVPKTPTGISYGTNGFRLPFSDNSGTTSTTLGKDSAGSNNWTPNNLSVASGSGNDSLVDTPTSYGTDTGAGGEVRGNYCTWNALAKGSDCTLSNGNLDVAWGSAGSTTQGSATIGMSSGKWYWETTITASSSSPTNAVLGITTKPFGDSEYPGYSATSWGYRGSDGHKWTNTSGSAYGASYANGDVVGVAFDADNGTLTFYKNGSSQGTAFSSLTSGPYFPAIGDQSSSQTFSAASNFGQRPFAYTAPSGFKALVDTNLTAPVIAKGSSAMDVKLYTGNGGTQSITGLAFNPDFVWIKCRTASVYHALFDVVRGVNKRLGSNETSAEQDQAPSGLSAFDSSGFTVVDGATGGNGVNGSPGGLYAGSAAQYAAWCWDAGTSTVTNTAGSITSSVRANATAGFSVVTWSGTNNDGTIGHGLGAQPALIIAKNRTSANEWCVLHSKGYNGSWGAGYLRQTAALVDITGNFTGSNFYDRTAPTSSVFSVSGNKYAASDSGSISGQNYVVYAFAPVAGYSSMGSYVSTGTSDNAFNFCGFRPRFLLLKNASVGNSWVILDSARSTFNAADDWLGPNSSSAEDSNNAAYSVDFLSNGFKVRSGNGIVGNSGDTVVWAAFAESPFAYARAR